MDLVIVATCNLNQWALDFDGNKHRIVTSIKEAKEKGAKYRLGPELEVCGYGCEDHYLEQDTFHHCDEVLAEILSDDTTDGILCDIGMPVRHNNVRYNCRIFCLDRKILLIRPKMAMADDGNYRESRYFTTWKNTNQIVQHALSPILREKTDQQFVPFGHGCIRTANTVIAAETCEELWTPLSPHIEQSLAGVEIIGNGSGSHHQLRKLDTRFNYIVNATFKCGGVYLYANQKGCDGGRLYFDGSALIVCNGQVLAQASQFSLRDVEVICATVSLESVRSKRASTASLMEQSSSTPGPEVISAMEFDLEVKDPHIFPTVPLFEFSPDADDKIENDRRLINGCLYHTPEAECVFGPACWLWDYLRRSGAGGYFLPLSGGADSSAVATIVGAMCCLVDFEVQRGNKEVLTDLRNILKINDFFPEKDEHGQNPNLGAQQIANLLLHTCYMGKKDSSTDETETRARMLSAEIGGYHQTLFIDTVYSAIVNLFAAITNETPHFLTDNPAGTHAEDLALQNIQARVRMVLSYLFASLLPWIRKRKGFLLVLSSANVDECLRGYMTKYDCSSGDLNPIGSISKGDLKRMLIWASKTFNYSSLESVAVATPTAELRPNAKPQTDEEDMGMSYEELGHFGRLRQLNRCGPVSMFQRLYYQWGRTLDAQAIAEKVQRFFKFYAINRHKSTTLTPSYHAEQYSPDDNRFDHRQFLYKTTWDWQFRKMNALAETLMSPPIPSNDT